MGKQAVTLQDIAARAGISKVAVAAALKDGQGRVFVSEATRHRVRALAEEMGYRPNVAARALATGRSRVVEFWAQNVQNPFFNAAFHAARRHLLARELSLSLVEFAPGPPPPQAGGWGADGLLVFDCPWKPERFRQVLETRGVAGRPCVTVGTYHQAEGDHVGVDLESGVRDAVSHLLSLGCRRVAYLLDRWDDYPEEPRYRAYTETVTAADRAPEYLVAPEGSRRAAREFLREYVRANGCPDALFCHNDLMAVGAYRALRDLEVRVPEQVRLIGCDGIEEIEYLDCPLSTVAQPVEAVCELACTFLHARIEDPVLRPQQRVLPAELVLRRSSTG